MLSADLSNRLDAVQAETLVIWGERDTLLDPSLGRKLAERLEKARFACVEGAGHNPMWDRPQRFNELLLEFLLEEEAAISFQFNRNMLVGGGHGNATT